MGANTNTFDLAARQSAFGGSFSGPEFAGFTPGGYFFAYIQNNNLTSDAYGLLPFQAYGDLKKVPGLTGGHIAKLANAVTKLTLGALEEEDEGNS